MNTSLKNALKFGENKRTVSNNSKKYRELPRQPYLHHNYMLPKIDERIYQQYQPHYQYPIHKNNTRVAFEVQHQPMHLHVRPETSSRNRQLPQMPQSVKKYNNNIQTVEQLCLKEGYIKLKLLPKAPVLLNRIKVNIARTTQLQRNNSKSLPRVLKTKPVALHQSLPKYKQSSKTSNTNLSRKGNKIRASV